MPRAQHFCLYCPRVAPERYAVCVDCQAKARKASNTEQPWMEEASCAQVDPELWYPERGGPSARAKAICNGTDKIKPCPVRLQCLGYAMENHEIHGIWGGLSEVERAQLRRGTPA